MNFGQYNLLFKRQVDSTFYFIDSDSEELYKKNLVEKPIDWLYRNGTITYKFNSLGFRCNELKDIDFDNYILFLGDSHTEGVGLHLENTYPYQVSKKLYKSYFNLGIGGTGIDVMFYNLITWLHTFPHPKYVVLFYTENTRSLINPGSDCDTYKNISAKWAEGKINQEDTNQFIVSGDLLGFFNGRMNLCLKMIDTMCKQYKIPYKNITTYEHNVTPSNSIELIDSFTKPRARDNHVGIEWHDEVTELLVNDYLDKYYNATFHSTSRGQSD